MQEPRASSGEEDADPDGIATTGAIFESSPSSGCCRFCPCPASRFWREMTLTRMILLAARNYCGTRLHEQRVTGPSESITYQNAVSAEPAASRVREADHTSASSQLPDGTAYNLKEMG